MRSLPLKAIVSLGAMLVAACLVLVVWSPWNNQVVAFYSVEPPTTQESQTVSELGVTQADSDTQLTQTQVEQLWQTVEESGDSGGWTTWGVVVDTTTGETLLDQDGQTAHTPASITKLLTAFTALKWLDVDSTMQTGTSLRGNTLYLWGEGDLLLAEGTGDAEAVNGRAGLADLADETVAQLQDLGISEVAVKYQDSLFSGDTKLETWTEQEIDNYVGQVGPYAINAGQVSADVWQFSSDSAGDVADVFVQYLEEQGITVTSVQTGTAASAPEEETSTEEDTDSDADSDTESDTENSSNTPVILASVSSATLREQINYFLVNSDNTLAEQYCHLSAAMAGAETTFQGATQNVIDTVSAAGVNTDELMLEDCSGLSENNAITGQTFIDLFQLIQSDSSTENNSSSGERSNQSVVADLVRLLPRGGVDGTLEERFTTGVTLANVQAKTGSLGVCSTLAGVVTTESGHVLLFAVGTDEVANDAAYWTRSYLDDFIAELAEL